jgi:copper chaperone CopZ
MSKQVSAAKEVHVVVRGMLCDCCEKKVKAILSVTQVLSSTTATHLHAHSSVCL